MIAFGKGGSLETVKGKFITQSIEANDTGVYFDKQNIDSLTDAIYYFEENYTKFNPIKIREFALTFDKNIFKDNIKRTFAEIIEKYKAQKN